MMAATATGDRVVNDTNGALTILKAARHGCLPMPTAVEVLDLYTKSTLTFWVRNLDDLSAWSIWLDAPISESVIGARVQHKVEGEMFDQPLRVLAFTKVAP